MKQEKQYTWMFGWLATSPDSPDVKINILHPATEVHIRKALKTHTTAYDFRLMLVVVLQPGVHHRP